MYLQKAVGQMTCARDAASELNPRPVEMVTRLTAMVREIERLQTELAEYLIRNAYTDKKGEVK